MCVLCVCVCVCTVCVLCVCVCVCVCVLYQFPPHPVCVRVSRVSRRGQGRGQSNEMSARDPRQAYMSKLRPECADLRRRAERYK
jgi:hypothetical protein